MTTATEITIEYNDDHSATATREINGTDYFCQCVGLSGCGEAFFEPQEGNPFAERSEPMDGQEEEYELWNELRQASLREVKRNWTYDGSNWIEPIDDPEVVLVRESDEDHQVGIVFTAFHNGGIVGYAEDEDAAQAWIDFTLHGNTCTCGCYCIVPADEVDDLQPHTECRSPYQPAS